MYSDGQCVSVMPLYNKGVERLSCNVICTKSAKYN